MAETYESHLDIKVGMKAISNMLNKDDNRTFAHELGHSGGTETQNGCGKLDDTEKNYSRKRRKLSQGDSAGSFPNTSHSG